MTSCFWVNINGFNTIVSVRGIDTESKVPSPHCNIFYVQNRLLSNFTNFLLGKIRFLTLSVLLSTFLFYQLGSILFQQYHNVDRGIFKVEKSDSFYSIIYSVFVQSSPEVVSNIYDGVLCKYSERLKLIEFFSQ